MMQVPEENTETVISASAKLSDAAKMLMFVADMLGNDMFELCTAEGFTIIIKKTRSDNGQST